MKQGCFWSVTAWAMMVMLGCQSAPTQPIDLVDGCEIDGCPIDGCELDGCELDGCETECTDGTCAEGICADDSGDHRSISVSSPPIGSVHDGYGDDGQLGLSDAFADNADSVCNCPRCARNECDPHYMLLAPKHYFKWSDNLRTKMAAKRCARRHLRRDFDDHVCANKHFRDGFTQAFVDVAFGANGELPAVPPKQYWHAKYRTETGHTLANDWMRGYASGATTALSARGANFIHVQATSPGYVSEECRYHEDVIVAPAFHPATAQPAPAAIDPVTKDEAQDTDQK